MAPHTALGFVFCGLALLLLDAEGRGGFRPAQVFVLAVGLIALLAIIGYAYRVLLLYGLGLEMPMSLDTAVAFAVFSLGFLAARPERGIMTVVTSSTMGGTVARRLLPMAIVIPWILGALLLLGEEAGYYGREFAVSLFAVASIVIFTGLIWWNAKLLYLSERERAQSERLLVAQHAATRVLAEAQNLVGTMPSTLQAICQPLGWPAGVLWLLDRQAKLLRCNDLWHQPEPALAAFIEAARGGTFAKGESLPGQVWALAQPVCIADLGKEEGMSRASLAAKAGLRGAIGLPLRTGQEFLGVMEFVSRQGQAPDEALLEMLGTVAAQVSLFLERTRAEAQLRRASADLQRSNTDLQQFAYVASHDLFEPLRMVNSYLQLLREESGEKLDPTSLEYIAFAIDGAKRMDALIRDLLAYSRVDSRGGSFAPTDCGRVFEAVLSNLKVAIEESGATVVHGPLPTVQADNVQLTQVFQNLIGNAIKFRGPQPPRIEVNAFRQDREWRFEVRDNGIGIDPRFFDRIFIIFQRLHTRQQYAGTGLGLAICKRILERHGGRIWVESSPGKGATFFFTLPVAPEA